MRWRIRNQSAFRNPQSAMSFVPALVLVLVVVVVVLFVLVVVLGGDVELQGCEGDHLEIRAAFGAAQLVALIDVELVDFDFGVALGAGGHTLSVHVESYGSASGRGTFASIATTCAVLQFPGTRESNRRVRRAR